MKTKILFVITVILFAFAAQTYAQFDKFSFQIGAGIVNPDKGLRGNDYLTYNNSYAYQKPGDTAWYYVTSPVGFAMVDTNFFAKNYAAKTGFFIQGTGKVNIDKYETVRLIGTVSFSSFNSFQSSKSGDIPLFYYDINNQYQATTKPISYDYSLNNFGLGLGIEVAPLSFTKVVSPFVNGTFNFNFLSAELSRTTGPNDSTKINFVDFRMGISLGAGVEFKVNPQWGLVLGAKYDFANLLLKNSDRNGLIEWGRTNASFNDEGGTYLSNLSSPLGGPYKTIRTESKDINWATFYIGVNFYPNFGTTTKKK